MGLHILTVTAFVEKDFPDLSYNQQTNKPPLSAGKRHWSIRSLSSSIQIPPILLSLALKRELAVVQSARVKAGKCDCIQDSLKCHSRTNVTEQIAPKGRMWRYMRGCAPAREGWCSSLPNQVMTHPGRKILPPWGYLDPLSLRVIRD